MGHSSESLAAVASLVCGASLFGRGCVGKEIGGSDDPGGDVRRVDAEPERPDAEPVPPTGGTQTVIIVGWDGVQRDHLDECMFEKRPQCPEGLPILRALSACRFYDLPVTTAAATTSAGAATPIRGSRGARQDRTWIISRTTWASARTSAREPWSWFASTQTSDVSPSSISCSPTNRW